MTSNVIKKELVLLGGGHSHIFVLKSLGAKPVAGLRVTLISPDENTPYSGMLPGCISGNYTEDEIHIDLVELCLVAGARLILDRAIGVDVDNQQVKTIKHADIAYDVLSMDIGITPAMNSVPGATENVIPVKPVQQFLARWSNFMERVSVGEIGKVGVVGGGAGGVELCLAMHHRLTEELNRGKINQQEWSKKKPSIEFHLLTHRPILDGHNDRVKKAFSGIVKDRGITLHNNFKVTSIEKKRMTSAEGAQLSVDEIFWVTTAASHAWLKNSGLSCDGEGFVEVKPTLQTLSHENIFAVGDIAHVIDHPRPKAGVFAVRQGPPLVRNLRLLVDGKKPKPFTPQKEFLSLISTGNKYAVASRGKLKIEGKWVWYWKDWVDRRFVQKFKLPA